MSKSSPVVNQQPATEIQMTLTVNNKIMKSIIIMILMIKLTTHSLKRITTAKKTETP